MNRPNVKCDHCKANPGEPCTGARGGRHVHMVRLRRAKIRSALLEADMLALDSARDRRVLEELLMEALR